MYKIFLSSILIMASLLLNAYAIDMHDALDGKEIRRLVSGNTIEGHFTKAREVKDYLTISIQFKDYFGADGEFVEKSSSPSAGSGGAGHVAAHGSWTTKKGKLCMQFRDARNNKKRCRKVIPMDEGKYGLYSGKGKLIRTWDRVVPGNPHELK
jgi:hypothetical protein